MTDPRPFKVGDRVWIVNGEFTPARVVGEALLEDHYEVDASCCTSRCPHPMIVHRRYVAVADLRVRYHEFADIDR